MFDFTGKNVIVTGAGEGIGAGICRAFAKAGANVVLNDIIEARARDMVDEINAETGKTTVHAFPCDVADTGAVYEMVSESTARIGVPDIVVANAGITRYVEFLETTPDMFDRIVSVNLRGTYFLAQAGAKQMIAHEKRGRIILMSSVVGLQAYPNFSAYGMTKSGIQMLAKTLALEIGQYGITVNSISPGATVTPRVLSEEPNYVENWAALNATGRVGFVDDIVAGTLFLASESAGHITGHNLVIDGGWTMQSPLPDDIPAESVDEAD